MGAAAPGAARRPASHGRGDRAMTTTRPPAGQPAIRPQPRGAAAATGQPLNAAAAWWMVYGALIDLGTLGVIGWLLRRDGSSYRSLLGPPTAAYALGRRLLPIMAARWVFNGGTALALALGVVG